MSWKKVKIGDILKESKIISKNPNPDRRITVRLKVLGVEKRGLENEVEGATKQYIRKAGQFIYGKQNFHKGAFGIVPPELDGFESSSDLPAFDVDKSCLPEFIFFFFKQGNFYLELSKIASGVATQRINTSQLFELELLLPDINTQRQLISNIQLLEKNGSQISSELTYQLTLVKKLRQQLLQDAVQGKLVEQNLKDEPASELLNRIKAEKAKLIAEKKLKKEKELTPIKPDEIPFEIPENWVWCRLGEICTKIHYGFNASAKPEKKDVRLLRITDIQDNKVDWECVPGCDYTESDLKNYSLNRNDIMIARTGGTIGKTYLVKDISVKSLFASYLIRAVPSKFLVAEYLKSFLESPIYWKQLYDAAWGAGQPNVNGTSLSNLKVPLPPLSEQTRIVQKLDDLMQYCNEMEASVKKSESQNEKLLQQVLREALRKEPVEV
jgi:type I restriction enzyme S subunit